MNVKFLLDENMPFALTEFFKKKGSEKLSSKNLITIEDEEVKIYTSE
jgi:predicted nuclease of predicted toxin-antitoxin system